MNRTLDHDDMPIKLVTFDLYDTLIELHPTRWERLEAACRSLGLAVDPEIIRAADLIAEDYYTEENTILPIRDRSDEARETFRVRYMARWLKAAGLQHDEPLARALRRAYVAELETPATRINYQVFDDVLPALARLREAGIKRAVISNADADVTDLCTRLAFAHEMNLIVTSAVVGWEKPDVRTFRAALDPLAIDPAATIHIGDQPRSDITGALATGMRAALIDRYGRHDPANHEVPIMRSLEDLVDYVVQVNEAGWREGAEARR